MVAHLLVDVEVGGGGASKPVSSLSTTISSRIWPGSSMNRSLTCLLELLDLVHGGVGRLVEVVGEHLPVDVVLPQLLGQALARVLLGMSPGCGS